MRIKSGQYNDIVFSKDHVSKAVARSFVVAMLKHRKTMRRPLQKLWNIDINALHQWFAGNVRSRGLQASSVTPHCARQGAASTDIALQVRTLEGVQR